MTILAVLMCAAFVAAVILAFAWSSADRPRDAVRSTAPLRTAGRRFLGA